MALELTIPMGKKTDVKNLCFTILSKEYPLKIVELTNLIRKRYGKSVTFQAVRKALLELTESGVLERTEKEFQINKEWVKDAKRTVDELYTTLSTDKPTTKHDSAGDVAVYTFTSLNDLMIFWQDIVDDWYKKFKHGDHNVNAYQGAHTWEGALHPDREHKVMGQLKKKGITSYSVTTENTPLDRNIKRFYESTGLKATINPSPSTFDKGYYVATYGDLIVQARYPSDLVKELDTFFKKNKTIEDLNLKELSDIVNKKRAMKLTVIKNLEMAKQINQSILAQMS